MTVLTDLSRWRCAAISGTWSGHLSACDFWQWAWRDGRFCVSTSTRASSTRIWIWGSWRRPFRMCTDNVLACLTSASALLLISHWFFSGRTFQNSFHQGNMQVWGWKRFVTWDYHRIIWMDCRMFVAPGSQTLRMLSILVCSQKKTKRDSEAFFACHL